MGQNGYLGLSIVLSLLLLITGCGGGGSNSGAANPSAGSITFALDWPERSYALPANAESITITLLSGTTVVGRKTLDRPAQAGRTIAQFLDLPAGTSNYLATAYESTGGTGKVLGTMSGDVTIVAGEDTLVVLTVATAPQIAHLHISTLSTQVAEGATLPLTVSAEDDTGQPVFANVIWESSNSSVATVDAQGIVTGKGSGTVEISVREQASGKSDSIQLTVIRTSRVTTISITPTAPQLHIGETVTLTAIAHDNNMNVVDADLRWDSDNPAIAQVNNGKVTAMSEGRTQITVTDADSGIRASISVVVYPQQTGGSGQIVFSSAGTIAIINVATSAVRVLTSGNYSDEDPVCSRDGTQIAFVRRSASNYLGDIYLMNTDGGNLRFITQGADPAFSPDGSTLVYAAGSGIATNIYLTDLATGRTSQLTSGLYSDQHPSVSPIDGTIVFASNRSGGDNIHLMNADGSNIRQLTDANYWNGHPVFSPDGQQIAFASNRMGDHTAYQTFLIRTDGNDEHRLLNVTHCSRMPCFSPNGDQLAFAANPERNFDIYIANSDGSGLTLLYGGAGKDIHPCWMP